MATESTAVTAREEPGTFPHMLVAYKAQIAAALPQHLTADRMCRIALTCFRLNPGLAKCEPASVFAAVVILAQQGLEPGLNGRAYLVPYRNNKTGRTECQAIPGWKGLVELANRTGRCSVWTGAVFIGDEFEYQLGDTPFVTHRPKGEDDPKKLFYTYAIGRVKGNDYPVIEVWPNEKIERHFRRYNKVGAMHYAHDNWEMYARKVPLLQVLKYMPASPELEAAMALSDSSERGAQNLNIKDAIDGTFMPTYDEEQTETKSAAVADINAKIAGKPKDAKPTAGAAQGDLAPPTLAYILDLVSKAKSADDCDVCEDLIRSLPNEAHRAEADVELRAKRKTLGNG